MVCLLEERVCNLVLLWCITVIAHHCKLVKLQSSISEYKPSDLWSYDDIEVARPQNESNIRLVKNNHGDSYYVKSDDRKVTRLNDEDTRDELPSLRNRDHFGFRTNLEIPIGSKSNDGEISISKKITFNANGNNSRANNHPLWFNALEKSAMSLPASISFNLKNLYGERKSESTKRPYENPGVVFASKTIPLNSSTLNRNKMKYQQANYEPEYDEPALPPSLPNLEIIPFVASDALDKPKEPVADRKEGIEYVEDETTPTDPASMIKNFSPPSLTEGGFIPRDPTLDELYYEAIKFNRTYSPPPQIIVTEMNSEYRVTESSQPKVPEIISEHPNHHYIEYSTMSTTTTPQKPAPTQLTTTTTTTTTAAPISTTTTTESPPTTPEIPPTPVIHFLTTKAANHSTLIPLLRHTSTSTSTTTTTTTTEDPSIEESEEGSDPEGGGGEEESEEEDEETIPIPDTEPVNKEPAFANNHTKEEPAEPEDNSLLSNILTMIFDDYPVPSKEKTTTLPPPSSPKKTTPAMKFTTPAFKSSASSSIIPPFKHVYIPPSFSPSTTSTTTTTTTTITPSTTTETTSTVKNMDKMGFISTRFSNNNTTTTMNETQQNQIKYVGLPQIFTYNQPVPKSTPKPVKERPSSHNEIYHSMKSDSVISGLLKLSGCNIFGKMYKTGEQIDELTEPCSRCMCSEAGVHCIQTKC